MMENAENCGGERSGYVQGDAGSGRRCRPGPTSSRGRFRPGLLALEDRRLPSTYTVTSVADDGSTGTLRWAVEHACTGGSNTIAFAPADFGTPRSILLSQGALLLTSGTITIDGPGAGLLTIDGDQASRVFAVDSGVTATISGLTIADGSATVGGGLYDRGAATLTDCTISGNSATSGGGLYGDGRLVLSGCTISGNSANDGGALWNRGTAALTGCTLVGNSAYLGGGASNYKYGHLNLTACTISGNSASLGGGLSNYGKANLTACTVSGNTAVNTSTNPASNPGGGIYNYSNQYGGLTTLVDTIVAGNSGSGIAASDVGGDNSVSVIGTNDLIGTGGSGGVRNGSGGDVVLTSLASLDLAPLGDYGGPTPTMPPLPGSAAIGAGASAGGVTTDQRGFALDSPVDIGADQAVSVSLVVAVATDGMGAPAGELDLRGAIGLADIGSGASTITFSSTAFATAQTIDLAAGPLTLTGTGGTVAIDGPAAGLTLDGGGLARVLQVDAGVTATLSGLTISGGSATTGGGVYNQGTATITDCTIAGNTAAADGGGLANVGVLSLVECTVSGNTAGGGGGGLYNDSQVALTACTVSGNTAGAGGGGIYEGPSGTDRATLGDTIVAGNAGGASGSDIGGTNAASVDGRYDLVGTGGSGGISNGSDGNIVLTSLADLALAPLGNYGGSTPSIALLPGCPAIGAGSMTLISEGVSTDQRGEPRVVGGRVDIGAFESQGFMLTAAASSTPQAATTGSPFADPLAVTVTAVNVAEPVAGGVITFTVNASGGAGAALSAGSATIAAGGSAEVTATAGSTAGQYSVTASAAGAAAVSFSLTNQGSIAFSGLASQSIVYGTASATFSGKIGDGSQVPAGEDVAVTLDGATQQAPIGSDGSFSTTFDATAGLEVADSPYTVSYAYSGDATFPSASQTSTLTVTPATPTVSIEDAGGTYSGSAFAATATVAGIDGHAGASLEGVGLTLNYYAGSSPSGSPLSGPPIAAGTYTVLAGFAGSPDYAAATAQATFAIAQAAPTLTWAAPGSIVYGTALGGSQLDATASVPGSFSYNPGSGVVLKAGAHTLSVTFTPTDGTDYTTATTTTTIDVTQATPAITWSTPAPITYGTPLGSGQLDATTSVKGTFTYTPAAGTIPGVGTDMLSVTFTPSDTIDYTTATASATLTVTQATPSITWNAPGPIVYGTGLGASQLDATASVPGTFSYAPEAGAVLGVGSHPLSVTFTPTDGTDYTTATATTTISVMQATPAITWSTPASIAYGTALTSAQLDASADTLGTFQYSPAAGAVLGVGNHHLSVTFTPTDSADYTTATASSTISVTQATPAITWDAPAAIVYGTRLSSTQLDATADVAGSFLYSPAEGAILAAGTGTLSVTFTPTDSTDYATATATIRISVTQAVPTIGLSGGGVYDGSPIPATATLTGVVPGVDASPAPSLEGVGPTLTYYVGSTAAGSPMAGAPTGAGPYTVVAAFPGSADYAAATAQTAFTIAQATPSTAWVPTGPIVFGTPLGPAQLDATASVPGTFSYSPAAGVVPSAGVETLSATFTPTDSTDYTKATASTSIAVTRATPTITWSPPASITFGTPLGASQLDATASVPGTFTYAPAAGTVPGAGTDTLSLTFTPGDTTDETTATASTTITVARATPVVGVSAAGGVYDGSPFVATATVAGVGGTSATDLEGVRPVLTYYAGGTATGTPLAGPPTAVGTYTVVASFPGSADYHTASSRPATFDITAPAVTVTLASSTGSTVFGQMVTLTATVSPDGPAAGTVTFLDGAATLGSASLDDSGRAVLTVDDLGLGGHSITAVYRGVATPGGIASGDVSESVSPAGSQVVLVPHAVLKKKRVVSLGLTAEIEPLPPGGGVPTGTVTFMMKKKRLGTATLSGGQATLAIKPASVLNKSITIIYSGDNDFRSASLATPKLTSRSLAAIPHPLLRTSRPRPALSHPLTARVLLPAGAKAGTTHAALSLTSTGRAAIGRPIRLEKSVSPL